MKNKYTPINGVVEPDFLKYLEDTFSRWNKLFDECVTLGMREISKFENVLIGANLNAHIGFEAYTHMGWDETTGRKHYTVLIFKNRREMEKEPPLYTFDTPIFK